MDTILPHFYSPSLGEECNKKDRDYNISYNVISVYHKNIVNCDEDRNARLKIKEILQKEFSEVYSRFNFVEINVDNGGGGGQANMWPTHALQGCEDCRDDELNLWFGYIRTDDFFHMKGHFVQLYDTYSKILSEYKDLGKNFKIVPNFPFEWSYKKDLVYLYSTLPIIFDNISWAGDDTTVKLKEKEELKTIMDQILMAKKYYCKGETKKDVMDVEKCKEILVEKEDLNYEI